MRFKTVLWLLLPLTLISGIVPAKAQVSEVVVGITPTCPYGLSACWAGAYEALGRLKGVTSVEKRPDAFNCTAHLQCRRDALLTANQWPGQFKSIVGNIYAFRGIEVTIRAIIEKRNGAFILHAKGLGQKITLAPLHSKIQWDYTHGFPRQADVEESTAYQRLITQKAESANTAFSVEITGPLTTANQQSINQQSINQQSINQETINQETILEVRNFRVLPLAPNIKKP